MPQSFQQFRGGDWLFSCLWGMGHVVVMVAIRVGFLLIAFTVGVLRSLGEGGHVSAELAEDSQGTTAYQRWGSSVLDGERFYGKAVRVCGASDSKRQRSDLMIPLGERAI